MVHGVYLLGALKVQGSKMMDKIARVENAGLKNDGQEFDG